MDVCLCKHCASMAALNTVTSNVILLSLLVVILAFEACKALHFYPKVTVEIINTLDTPPPKNLTLHCQSKDDDLGSHTIMYGGSYNFTFRPSVVRFITTLYWCSFSWKQDPSLHHFEIFKEDRDDTCVVCSWKISTSGGCKYDKFKGTYSECYPWIKQPSTYMEAVVANNVA